MPNPYSTLELLAPAGNLTCLHAAVRSGADAVYLGCEDFNARRGADNFTLDTLEQACDFAHMRGVSVYLTTNIAIMPDEASKALELVRQAWRRGVDAFIVQDIGLAAEIQRTLPEARLHISTQMNTHNVDGVRAAAALGAKRVTLARELTLPEVREVSSEAKSLDMETECFGHGALCVCYSGQCFMSSLIGGRSANRGTCAQACRLPYTLYNASSGAETPAPGEHLLSPKDLCTIDMLPELVGAGVSSVKIEGRMKSPEYVSVVVGVYRSVLDRLAAAADEILADQGLCVAEGDVPGFDGAESLAVRLREMGIGPTDEERQALAEAFSRGFTQGYLVGERGNDLMSYGRPNNRGVFVGRVARVDEGVVTITSDVELHEGDVLEFWTNKGHFAVPLARFDVNAQGEYRFAVERRVNKADRVFRVRDASLAFVDDSFEPRLPVSCAVDMQVGQPLRIEARSLGRSVVFEGPVVDLARTKPVTPDEVRDHVDRLGNTPFYLDNLDVSVEQGVGIGFSALHKARSQALKRLEEELLSPWRGRELRKVDPRPAARAHRDAEVTVAAFATNPACARAARRAGADAVYVPVLNYRRGTACIAGQLAEGADQAGYPSKRIVALPVVEKEPMNADFSIDVWDYVKPDKPLFAENFGQVLRGIELGAQVEVGPHVPVTNALTLAALGALGVQRVWLSPELSLKQIRELGQNAPVGLGLTIAGFQELMTCEHCLLMSQGPCNQRCGECPRRRSEHVLEDRKGYRFPVITDACGRSHLYNAVPFDAAHVAGDLVAAGVTSFMVDTTLMTVDETSAAVARALKARDAAVLGRPPLPKKEGCTTGHLFRGVQ